MPGAESVFWGAFRCEVWASESFYGTCYSFTVWDGALTTSHHYITCDIFSLCWLYCQYQTFWCSCQRNPEGLQLLHILFASLLFPHPSHSFPITLSSLSLHRHRHTPLYLMASSCVPTDTHLCENSRISTPSRLIIMHWVSCPFAHVTAFPPVSFCTRSWSRTISPSASVYRPNDSLDKVEHSNQRHIG